MALNLLTKHKSISVWYETAEKYWENSAVFCLLKYSLFQNRLFCTILTFDTFSPKQSLFTTAEFAAEQHCTKNWICSCLPMWQIGSKYMFTPIANIVNQCSSGGVANVVFAVFAICANMYTLFLLQEQFYKNNEAQFCPKIKNELRTIEARFQMQIYCKF